MSNMPHVVVIGAGALGMCSAYLMSEKGAKVTVLEAQSIASASTGRSVGVVGTQLFDPFDIALRKLSFEHLDKWEKNGLFFNKIGYLRLARNEEQMLLLKKSVEMQKEAGFSANVFAKDELQQIIPHISTDGLCGGIFGAGNGYIDPYQLCTILADKLKENGGIVKQMCKVEGVEKTGAVYHINTTRGNFKCDVVVNAAGAWASSVAALFGQELNIRPERHEAVSIHLESPLNYTMPMVMDLVNGEGTGLNFRHEKKNELIAEIHKGNNLKSEDPDFYNELCNEDSKVYLAELLLERLPNLPGPSLGKGWAGLYPMTKDNQPFVGPVDFNEPTIITAAGAGGYGIQLAPAIGQLTADWALYGHPVSIPDAYRLLPNKDRNILF